MNQDVILNDDNKHCFAKEICLLCSFTRLLVEAYWDRMNSSLVADAATYGRNPDLTLTCLGPRVDPHCQLGLN